MQRFLHSLLLLLLLAPTSSAAASSLRVVVLDPQNAVVASAELLLTRRDSSWRGSARTNDQGFYEFVSLPAGDYLLSVTAADFAGSGVVEVSVASNVAEEIEIGLIIASLEESIVVTAAAQAERQLQVTKSVDVVSAREIEERDEYFLPEALRTVPGLRVQQLGGPGSFTSIKTRGLRSEDTAVIIDGARFRDVAAPQGDASSYLDAFVATDVERVEIVRGSNSTLYGTNAGGGVINIVTSPGGGPTRGRVLAEGGGLGFFRANARIAGEAGDRLHYGMGVSQLNVLDGVDGNDETRNTSFQGRVQLQLSPISSFAFRLYTADARLDLNESPEALGQLPGGIIDAGANVNYVPGADDPDSTRDSRFISALASYDARLSPEVGLTVRYHALLTERNFFDGPLGTSAFEPVTQTLSEFEGDVHTLSARGDVAFGVHQVDAGYEYEHESFLNRSFPDDPASSAATDATQSSHAVYAQHRLSLFNGALAIAAGARAQVFSLDAPTLTPIENAPYAGVEVPSLDRALTGDLSGVYSLLPTTRIRAHFGTGYRSPSLFERYGTSFSSFGYSAFGDPRLSPERSRTFDLGVERDFLAAGAQVSATYFRTRLQEIILFDFSGLIDSATDPFGRFGGYVSTDGGTTEGLELSGSFATRSALKVKTSYTFTEAEPPTGVSDTQSQAFVVPRHQFALVATQRVGRSFTVSVDLVATGAYLAPIFDTSTFTSRVYRFGSTVKSDLTASYRWDNGLRLLGKIENLFDEAIFEGGFATPGRYAVAGVSFDF